MGLKQEDRWKRQGRQGQGALETQERGQKKMRILGMRVRDRRLEAQGMRDVGLLKLGSREHELKQDEGLGVKGLSEVEAGPRPGCLKLMVRPVDKTALQILHPPSQGSGLPLTMGCGGLPTSGESRCVC